MIHHSLLETGDATNESKSQGTQAEDQEAETPSSFLYDAALYIGSYFTSAESQRFPNGTISTQDLLKANNRNTPIQFGASKKNLLVLADEKSGSIALCSQETFPSDDNIGRLLINIQPQVLLIPSISGD